MDEAQVATQEEAEQRQRPAMLETGAQQARRVRCPRDGHGFMREASADPKTGQGRILRCTADGCYMVAEIPGVERLRRALLNRAAAGAADRRGKAEGGR